MLNKLTLKKALDLLSKKDISLDELYADLNVAIEQQNPQLNAYLTLNPNALETAKKNFHTQKPLLGIPLAVKDNFCTTGLKTTASTNVLKEFKPTYDSTVTNKLKNAGAVVHGKTNMDAWAHGSSTETSDFGRTLNPRNTEYLPGGSSGGTAAVVAGNLGLAGIGSETAGSIRLPASWCGIVGLKPTYGRVSRYGVIAMASSTDSPGPMTKTVEDAAILFEHLAGNDPKDGTSSPLPVPKYCDFLDQDIRGTKIGVLYGDLHGLEDVNPIIKKELEVFERLGAEVEFTEAMDPYYSIGVYTIVQRSEVSSNLSRYDGIRFGNDRSFFGDEAKRRIMLGTFALSKGHEDNYYSIAQKVRTLYKQDFARLFKKYDVLVSPTTPSYAMKVGATEGAVMFGELADLLAEPSSLSGNPGISVPCFHDPKTNLFLGLNIMAPMYQEEKMIKVADAYEKATNWNTWRNQT